MNKIKLIIFISILIVVFSIIGLFIVQASEEIKTEEDIIERQNKITDSNLVYGYTFDNPNIIIDPYKENYQSVLIMFETKDYISLKVVVNDEYNFNTPITNRHYIGIVNLKNGINNIKIIYNNEIKDITLTIKEEGKKIDFTKASILKNGHLLVGIDKKIDNDTSEGLREIDALGKIYYEYIIEDGYKYLACEIDEEKLAVLSKNLIILDRQNGNIIKTIDISKYNENWETIKYEDNKIKLYTIEKGISIDLDGNIEEFTYSSDEDNINNEIDESTYNERLQNEDDSFLKIDCNAYYNNKKAVRFSINKVTKTSNKNIWLLKYSKKGNYNVEIKKEFNRIVVSSKDIKECNSYIILDKFPGKKVYELCNNTNYIYTSNLKGKYSIYLKIGDKVYKTDKYIQF